MKNPNSINGLAKTLIYVGLIIVAIITLVPFIWLIASTFKSNYEIVKVPGTFFPKKITFEHYTYIVG
ncbi:MAG: hypothetical protein PHD05_03340, partial [Sphaerochaetaceae bacterium]|nr:hypothetical protein [Sphaerochaetaceae bacterium]